MGQPLNMMHPPFSVHFLEFNDVLQDGFAPLEKFGQLFFLAVKPAMLTVDLLRVDSCCSILA